MRTTNNDRLHFDLPVVFIFDTDKIASQVYRVFPFDTGAFLSSRLSRFFDRDSQVGSYQLPADIGYLQKLVDAFYQSNLEYFTGASRKNADFEMNQFEAAGIYELARAPADPYSQSHISIDERSSSFEMQFKTPISIKDSILSVLLPEKYLSTNEWVEALSRWGVSSINTYSVFNNLSPDGYAGIIYSKVGEYLKSNGYIS